MPLPEDFNKKVAAVARMKPVKTEGDNHTPRNDPRRAKSGGNEGRDKKRRKGFKKKANAAKADIQSALSPEETGKRNSRPQEAGRRAAPSRDGGRFNRKPKKGGERNSSNERKDPSARGGSKGRPQNRGGEAPPKRRGSR